MKKYAIVEIDCKDGTIDKFSPKKAELTEEEIKCKYRLCGHFSNVKKDWNKCRKNACSFDEKLKKVLE